MECGGIPGVDVPLSRLIMGSTACSTRDLALTCAMLDHFISLGGTTIDTAHVYGHGDAERAIGAWLQLRDNRGQVLLIDKGGHYDDHGPRVDPTAISSDLVESLERLRTGYIDLYLLHRDDPNVPVGPIVEILNEHHRAGRIRAFGGSNWSTARLDEANEYAREHGLVPFVAGSPQFSLAVMNEPPFPGCISATIEGKDWYTQHQFPLLAWSAQAKGFFNGRYTPQDRSNATMVRMWYSADNFARLERARELGHAKGVSANVIALAYVLCQPFPGFAVIGPRTPEQLDSSFSALSLSLSPEELQWLNLEH